MTDSFYRTLNWRSILGRVGKMHEEEKMDKYMFPLLVIAVIIAFFYFRSDTGGEEARENVIIGAKYLAKNINVEGVVETDSGLQHLLLTPGTGIDHPIASDRVKVHYHGTLIDGTVFDSSVERGTPLSFGLGQVIPGWTEGLQLMVVGEKRRFFIPSELAYGNRSSGVIKPGSTLIFDVELLEISE